jgi:WD40 repeat protein
MEPRYIANGKKKDEAVSVIDLKEHTAGVTAVAPFSDDNLASASRDRTIKLWDTKSGFSLKTLRGHANPVLALSALNDVRLASAGEEGIIKLWDTQSQRCLMTLNGNTSAISALTTLNSGKFLFSGSKDKTINLWDTQHGRRLTTLTRHTKPVLTLANLDDVRLASGDGHLLNFGEGDEGTIMLWDVRLPDPLIMTLREHTKSVLALAALGDGRLASASYDKTIKIWDTQSGRCLMTLVGHTQPVQALATLVNGRLLFSGSCDQTIKLWDTQSGSCLMTLVGHTHSICDLAVLAAGRRLASASFDKTIKLWDIQSLKLAKKHEVALPLPKPIVPLPLSTVPHREVKEEAMKASITQLNPSIEKTLNENIQQAANIPNQSLSHEVQQLLEINQEALKHSLQNASLQLEAKDQLQSIQDSPNLEYYYIAIQVILGNALISAKAAQGEFVKRNTEQTSHQEVLVILDEISEYIPFGGGILLKALTAIGQAWEAKKQIAAIKSLSEFLVPQTPLETFIEVLARKLTLQQKDDLQQLSTHTKPGLIGWFVNIKQAFDLSLVDNPIREKAHEHAQIIIQGLLSNRLLHHPNLNNIEQFAEYLRVEKAKVSQLMPRVDGIAATVTQSVSVTNILQQSQYKEKIMKSEQESQLLRELASNPSQLPQSSDNNSDKERIMKLEQMFQQLREEFNKRSLSPQNSDNDSDVTVPAENNQAMLFARKQTQYQSNKAMTPKEMRQRIIDLESQQRDTHKEVVQHKGHFEHLGIFSVSSTKASSSSLSTKASSINHRG